MTRAGIRWHRDLGGRNGGEEYPQGDRLRKFWSGNNRFRLMLTLELAVMLPAAALIYLNYHQLKSIERDKVLEAAIHRDFQQMLAISEKQINHKAYTIIEGIRDRFPSPDADKGGQITQARMDPVRASRAGARVPLRGGPGIPLSFAAAANERSVIPRGASAPREDVPRVVRLGREDDAGGDPQEDTAHLLVPRARQSGPRATSTRRRPSSRCRDFQKAGW